MQLKKISALCALAAASMAVGSANAALTGTPKTVVDDANTNSRVIFVSGASAIQRGFTAIVAGLFTGTPTYFADAATANFNGVAGTLAAGNGTWSGQNVIIVYRVLGGSIYGVNSVARADSITAMSIDSTNCGATGSGTASSPYICTTTTSLVPDAGVSDIAPVLFKEGGNTEGEVPQAQLSDAELALLTSTPLYTIMFGVPVTANVNAGVILNRAAVAAIMTGNISNWSQVDSLEANTGANDIVICRRTPGSGTQAVYNMYFNNFPCGTTTSTNLPIVDRDTSGNFDPSTMTYTVGATGYAVVENSTSGDVRKCLDAAATGSTTPSATNVYQTTDRDGVAVGNVTVKFNGGPRKAIGVLSMDSLSNSTSAGNWQFRSLGGAGKLTQSGTTVSTSPGFTGILPTKASQIDGSWDMQGWVSFNLPARTTGAKKSVLDKLVVNAQNPANLTAVAALKEVAAAVPAPFSPFNPATTANVSRSAYGGGDQCLPLTRDN